MSHEEALYKWLKPGRVTTYQNSKWPVRVGQWTPKVANPSLCSRGWHLATVMGVSCHLPTTLTAELWLATGKGNVDADFDKIAFSQAKLVKMIGELDENTLHKLACDFAEHVLPIWENKYPNDDRPRKAIEAKRQWIVNKTDNKRLARAAREAARAAAAAAATAAAARAAAAAAATAAAAAATAAAAAARAAARAERYWQGQRIIDVLSS